MKTEKELSEIYLSILDKIKSYDFLHEWMTKPFNAFGKSMATNGYILVTVPASGNFTNQEEKITNVYPFKHHIEKTITLSELKEKLSEFPVVDCFDEKQSECNACYGKGTVEFEFEHRCKSYSIEGECPICEGEGTLIQESKTPNGKKQFDYKQFFGIGNSIFRVERIEELLFIANALNQDINLVSQESSTKPSIFTVGEIEILLMPSIKSDDVKVSQTIS